jgi:hypothetical protein
VSQGCTYTNTDTAVGAGGKLTSIGACFNLDSGTNGTAETIRGPQITDNTFTGYYTVAWAYCSNMVFLRNIIKDGVNGLLLVGGYNHNIAHNYIEADDGDAQTGRTVMYGRKLYAKFGTSDYIGTGTTDFEATTITEGSATDWDLADVLADYTMLAIVSTTNVVSPVPVYYGVIVGVDDASDQLTVDRWIKCADQTVETPADNTYYVSVARWPDSGCMVYNILKKKSAASNVTYDYNPRSGNTYKDYNLYDAVAENLGNASSATLTALQTKWQTWPTAHEATYYNDSYSRVSDYGTKTGVYVDMDGDAVPEWVGIPQSSGTGLDRIRGRLN